MATRAEPFVNRDDVLGAEFSPDGACLVTFSLDKTARIWDLKTGGNLHSLASTSAVQSARFSPDSKRLLTTDWRPRAVLWDVGTGEELPMTFQHEMTVNSAQFSA